MTADAVELRRMVTAVNVLGVPVMPFRWPELRDEVIERIRSGRRTTVMYANIHVVNTAQTVPELRTALSEADLLYCDGEGIRLAARLLGEALPERVTGAEFIWDLARRLGEEDMSLYWVGGSPGTAARALEVLHERHPALRVAGSQHGFFAKAGPESERVIEQINEAAPALVMIGMGTPIQELWVRRYRDRINAPVVWCIGATADFVTGVQTRGPALLTQHGFEWLARLAYEPRRMFRRYVIGNPLFAARIVRARLADRR
jgi:N-acetylglucosaminyldiphosphoundecaprenol N-acetyl-beta-D-mannosaminyltransferase